MLLRYVRAVTGALCLGTCLWTPGCHRARAPESTAGAGGDVVKTGPWRSACRGKARQQGDRTLDVVSGGMKRSALVHAPAGYEPTVAAPLVLAFHFAGGSPLLMEQATRLNDSADVAGMLVAYPAGVEGSFNAGKCCGKALEDGVDDVGFTRALLDALGSEYCVDPWRVFVAGMSNGGMMAYRLGCEMAERFAGVAVVSGALHTARACEPARSIPLLHIHGTADTSIPYEGGVGKPPVPVSGDLDFLSVEGSLRVFRSTNGCAGTSRPTDAKGDATCAAWSPCAEGSTVELCTIDGGGHTWPGGIFPPGMGKTSRDMDASAKIVKFFLAHPRR